MNLLALFKTHYSHDKLYNSHTHIGVDFDNLDDAINGLGSDTKSKEPVTITAEEAISIRKKFERTKNRWKQYLGDFDNHDKEMGPLNVVIGAFKTVVGFGVLVAIMKMLHHYFQIFS